MFEPIIVDKNVDLNPQQRELVDPVLELPLPETRPTQDNWSQEQMDLHQHAPQLPDMSSMYRNIETWMNQADQVPTMNVGAESVDSDKAAKAEKLPLPSTASSPVAGVAAWDISGDGTSTTIPITVGSDKVEAETIPITVAHSSPSPSRLPLPTMPSMGNVVVAGNRGKDDGDDTSRFDVIVNENRPRPRPLPLPDTSVTKRELRTSHSSDDPYGTLYEGQKVLDEVGAYSHLSDEMLHSMQDNQRMERDFRASQIQLFRKAAADLAEDNRRIGSIESAFELGRECLSDVNI